ncbi:MAG: hypothetical protein BBJ60_05770 [Desulfobacterales bacterium S7086C20]|nr:MAG: hypothetical protein BBJ60_05770 [Desulfobacterales bacterium S7086C20]
MFYYARTVPRQDAVRINRDQCQGGRPRSDSLLDIHFNCQSFDNSKIKKVLTECAVIDIIVLIKKGIKDIDYISDK